MYVYTCKDVRKVTLVVVRANSAVGIASPGYPAVSFQPFLNVLAAARRIGRERAVHTAC